MFLEAIRVVWSCVNRFVSLFAKVVLCACVRAVGEASEIVQSSSLREFCSCMAEWMAVRNCLWAHSGLFLLSRSVLFFMISYELIVNYLQPVACACLIRFGHTWGSPRACWPGMLEVGAPAGPAVALEMVLAAMIWTWFCKWLRH